MLVARERLKTWFRGFAVAATLFSTLTAAGQGREASKGVTQSPAVNGIRIVRSNVHHDVSLPLRDLIQANPAVVTSPLPEDLQEAEPVRPIPLPLGLKPAADPDPVLQGAAPLAPAQLGP